MANVFLAAVPNPKGCTEDSVSVSALPDDWIEVYAATVPVHSSGDTLERYLAERGARHEHALARLHEEAGAAGMEVEGHIRVQAEMLLSHIQQYDKDVLNILDKDVVYEEEKNTIENKLMAIWTQKVEDIYTFKNATDLLESRRVESLRSLLGEHFKKLTEIGHHSPILLLEDFQDKIYTANQQLLCNARAHCELRTLLLAEADAARGRALAKLEELAIKPWHRRARSSSCNLLYEESSKKDSTRTFPQMVVRSRSHSSLSTSCSESASELHTLKEEVRGMFLNFYVKLQVLHEDLLEQRVEDSVENARHGLISESQKIQSVILNSPEEEASYVSEGNVNESAMSIHEIWHQGVRSLEQSLGDKYQQLRDSVQLCNLHARTLRQHRKLTATLLEQSEAPCDTIEREMEEALKEAVQELRQSADHDRLDKQYRLVQLMEHELTLKYNKDHEIKLEPLTTFADMLELSTQVLLEKIRSYIGDKRSPTLSVQEESHEDALQFNATTALQENALVAGVKACVDELSASLSRKLLVRPERLHTRITEWIQDRTLLLKINLKSKVTSHAARAQGTRQNALERRREELESHELRLASHLQASSELLGELMLQASTLTNVDFKDIFPLQYWLEDIHKRMLDGSPAELKLLSYQQRLSRMRHLYETSLDAALERYRTHLDSRLEEARRANEEFLARIQLFSEGGEFSTTEASRATSALSRAGAALGAARPRIVSALETRRAHLLAAAHSDIQLIENVVNEAMRKFRAPPPPKISGKKAGKK